MESAFHLRCQKLEDGVLVQLVLRDPLGREFDWVDVPLVTRGHHREAALAARVVATASGGAISRGQVLRSIRELRGAA